MILLMKLSEVIDLYVASASHINGLCGCLCVTLSHTDGLFLNVLEPTL